MKTRARGSKCRVALLSANDAITGKSKWSVTTLIIIIQMRIPRGAFAFPPSFIPIHFVGWEENGWIGVGRQREDSLFHTEHTTPASTSLALFLQRNGNAGIYIREILDGIPFDCTPETPARCVSRVIHMQRQTRIKINLNTPITSTVIRIACANYVPSNSISKDGDTIFPTHATI